MARIENLTGHYTLHGIDRVRSLVNDLEEALNEITVTVVWRDGDE